MDAGQTAPLVFAAWADELARGLIVPRVGEAGFTATYGKRDYRAALEGILERNDAWWCQPQSCAEQSAAALARALDRLQAAYGADPARWRWGDAAPGAQQPPAAGQRGPAGALFRRERAIARRRLHRECGPVQRRRRPGPVREPPCRVAARGVRPGRSRKTRASSTRPDRAGWSSHHATATCARRGWGAVTAACSKTRRACGTTFNWWLRPEASRCVVARCLRGRRGQAPCAGAVSASPQGCPCGIHRPAFHFLCQIGL